VWEERTSRRSLPTPSVAMVGVRAECLLGGIRWLAYIYVGFLYELLGCIFVDRLLSLLEISTSMTKILMTNPKPS
jgi:hypothetical protein